MFTKQIISCSKIHFGMVPCQSLMIWKFLHFHFPILICLLSIIYLFACFVFVSLSSDFCNCLCLHAVLYSLLSVSLLCIFCYTECEISETYFCMLLISSKLLTLFSLFTHATYWLVNHYYLIFYFYKVACFCVKCV